MKYTGNHKLKKPENNDNYDIENENYNMDIIDKGISPFFVATLDSTNVYKITTGNEITELNDGFSVKVSIPSASIGSTSLIVDKVSAIPIKKVNGNAVTNLKSNGVYSLTYYNGNFILASGSDDSDSTSVGTDGSNVKVGETFIGTDGEIHTGTYTSEGTITAGDVLSGKIGYSKGNKIIGDMVNRGAPTTNLICGGTYNIPAGYYSGGKVTANSLASQTPANATAAQILAGYNAWVNGNLINGNAIKAKSAATIEKIIRDGIGWDASGTVSITFNTPFDILLVDSYIIANNGQLQTNYLPIFTDNRIVLSISSDRKTLYMKNTSTSCGWNKILYFISINYKE